MAFLIRRAFVIDVEAVAIAKALGTTVEYLVTGEDSSRAEQELKLLKGEIIELATS